MQLRALDLISAWQNHSPPAGLGHKRFMNLAGVPVGDARLPFLPLDEPSTRALQQGFQRFCAEDREPNTSGRHLWYMCRKHENTSSTVP